MCDNHHLDTVLSTSAATATPAPDGDTALCPVMSGGVVDKATAEANGLRREYEADSYWLCCTGCGLLWDADPDRYAAG